MIDMGKFEGIWTPHVADENRSSCWGKGGYPIVFWRVKRGVGIK
jgi:hypothetical protein